MSSVKVMVVDDEPQARRVLRTALIAHGFEVMDARTGEEAVQNLRQETPDVILLDLKMPRCDGYYFRVRQLADPRLREIPTVVFTADANVDGPDARPLGGVPLVRKSAPFAELAALVDRVGRHDR